MSLGDEFVKKLEKFIECSGCLPLDEILDLINEYSAHDVSNGIQKKPWLFHCLLAFDIFDDNDASLELEIIETLLNIYPEVANIAVDGDHAYGSPGESYYPLHAACKNGCGQDEMIKLLLKRNAKGLDHMCAIGYGIVECYKTVAGTPLHYYVYWGNRNIEIIKLLVEACPEALTMGDENTFKLTPLHTILLPPNKPDLDTVKFLVDLNPSLLSIEDNYGRLPIHSASSNDYITPDVMKFLIKACPGSLEVMDVFEDLPLHHLLRVTYRSSKELNNAPEILKLFVNVYPRSVFQERDGGGKLPIQTAAASHGPGFCKLLVDLFPGSERDEQGKLAIFTACEKGRADTVKYLADIYPESIHMTCRGMNLLYLSICCGLWESEKVKVLLELDDSFVSSAAVNVIGGHTEPLLPLHTACMKWDRENNEDSIFPNFDLVKALFDYYPAAILVRDEGGNLPADLVKAVLEGHRKGDYTRNHLKKTITFLETQHGFMEEARSHEQLIDPDDSGLLLLHRALSVKDISIGTIKTIVNGNLSALQVGDDCGRCPLHVACMNSSLDIVQYLLDLDTSTLGKLLDSEGNNVLHLACTHGNWKVINFLLDMCASLAMSVNKMNLLPLHLLCDQTGKEDIQEVVNKDSPAYYSLRAAKKKYDKKYIDSIWNLLLAYPSAVSSAV